MCDFEAKWFGASYIDGACHEGHMWDLDGDGPGDEFNPCPRCNTEAFLRDAQETAESSCGMDMFTPWCGALVWERAVEIAQQENPEIAARVIAEIGQVAAIDWPDRQAVFDGRAPYNRTVTTIYDYAAPHPAEGGGQR